MAIMKLSTADRTAIAAAILAQLDAEAKAYKRIKHR